VTCTVTVRDLDALGEAAWDFRTSSAQWQHPHGFGMGAGWDPFPAYRHDYAEASATVLAAAAKCPPLYDITLYLADREDKGRTNGWSHLDKHHYGDEGWLGVIMLLGKRIPPHPGITRHLAAHEYGHHAEWMLNMARGAKTPHSNDVAAEYMRVRGLPPGSSHHGEGGTWHDSVHEIFACDFRILVCGAEPEYWPHPGVPRPGDVPGLDRWWADAVSEIGAAAGGTGSVTLT